MCEVSWGSYVLTTQCTGVAPTKVLTFLARWRQWMMGTAEGERYTCRVITHFCNFNGQLETSYCELITEYLRSSRLASCQRPCFRTPWIIFISSIITYHGPFPSILNSLNRRNPRVTWMAMPRICRWFDDQLKMRKYLFLSAWFIRQIPLVINSLASIPLLNINIPYSTSHWLNIWLPMVC